MTGKVAFYYELLMQSAISMQSAGVFFVSKNITLDAIKQAKNIKKNIKLSKQEQSYLIRLLNKIGMIKSNQKWQVSHEMIFYLALNYITNELEDLQARNRFMLVPIITILDKMHSNWKEAMHEHYDFFSKLEDMVLNIKQTFIDNIIRINKNYQLTIIEAISLGYQEIKTMTYGSIYQRVSNEV